MVFQVHRERCFEFPGINRTLRRFYRSEFSDFRSKLAEYAKPNTQPIYWTFRARDIFQRLDSFITRLNEIKEIFNTANEFKKLEKVEIGGLRGRAISRKIQEIYDDYSKLYQRWSSIQYDPLDPDPREKGFERDRHRYQERASVLERRLASQFVIAFEECFNVEQLMKLVQVLGSLLNRPLIQPDVMKQISSIVDLFDEDISVVEAIFEQGEQSFQQSGLAGIPIDEGFPPVAGAITWVHKLRDRLNKPIAELAMIELS